MSAGGEDLTSILHAIRDVSVELMDLNARVEALEKRLEKGETLRDECCEDCCCG